MSRDHKGPKSCLNCHDALISVYERQMKDIVDEHTLIAKMMSESSYCSVCGAKFCLTMRLQDSEIDKDQPQFSACDAALEFIIRTAQEKAKPHGYHSPIEHRRDTTYTWCTDCCMRITLSTYTGEASNWFKELKST